MNLNPQQLKAVQHTDGPLLVLAGPGSGKTRVLVHRISRLIGKKVAYPSEILAVTFTNKAADEMRRRVEELVGNAAREIVVGTFHSVCLRLLRGYSEKFGYSSRFVIYDEADQLALIKECMLSSGLDADKFPPRSILERVSRAKDECMGADGFASGAAGNFYLEKISRVFSLYERRLVELQAMDFGDLIRLAVKLFDDDPEILESYQKRWRYILVDEYQDTNRAQYRLVEHLACAHRNICVVGDDDQSIYRWRGADIANILGFEKDFPGCEVVRLEQNYRSTKEILSAANSLIANNAGRKGKRIWTENGAGSKIEIISCDSERKEAEEVAGRISAMRGDGRRYGDVSIFYRTNAQSRPFEEAFRASGIPYRIYGGVRFYERAEIRDVLAYLKLLVDPKDDVSAKRIINVPARGIGKTTVARLSEFARRGRLSLFEAIGPFVDSEGIQKTSVKRLAGFCGMMRGLIERGLDRPLGGLVRDLLEASGYIEALAGASSIESENRIENINELITAMEEFVPADGGQALSQFLDQVALISDVDGMDESAGAVTLMTIHLAKGLEFPSVFMVGMEEGLFPHARSLDDPAELEEERRLCYVGMTRAMERLILSHAYRRRQFGSERYHVSSRFLDELPSECVQRILLDSRGAVKVPEQDIGYGFDQRLPEEVEGIYAAGMRVRHPSFGIGVINRCERTSAGHKVVVRFNAGYVKRLIAEFAGLVPL